MSALYAQSLYFDAAATLEDLREAVTTLEEMERTARRVLGGAHPTTGGLAQDLHNARAALRTGHGIAYWANRGKQPAENLAEEVD
jgi:hypothetical protein